MSNLPRWSHPCFEHIFISVFFSSSVEIAGCENRTIVRQPTHNFVEGFVGTLSHFSRVIWRRKVNREPGQQFASGQLKGSLQDRTRIPNPSSLRFGESDLMKLNVNSRIFCEKGDIDTPAVLALDQHTGLIPKATEVFISQPL